MLPDRTSVLLTLRGCCKSIGLEFTTPSEMEQFPIKTLTKQISDASPTTWNASIEMFAALIQLRFLKNQCFISGFDHAWFANNDDQNIFQFTVFLTNNAVDLS
jgi:hypothetical protein